MGGGQRRCFQRRTPPLLELQRGRDPPRRRVLRDGRRRRFHQRVPARQAPQAVQLPLDGLGGREPLREGESGVGQAVDILARDSVRLHNSLFGHRDEEREVGEGKKTARRRLRQSTALGGCG